jgi:hypothetical protein
MDWRMLSSQRQALHRHHKGGVHEKAADRVHAEAAGFVATAVHPIGEADRLGPLPPEGELGRVLEDQDRAAGGGEAIPRRPEMTGEDLRFADPLIGEEAVSRLRVGPVLAG